MYDIDTIADLIDALGGDTAVARWLGISQPAVNAWKARQDIPGGWHMALFARLVAMDKTINPAVFGYETSAEIRKLMDRVGNSPGATAAA